MKTAIDWKAIEIYYCNVSKIVAESVTSWKSSNRDMKFWTEYKRRPPTIELRMFFISLDRRRSESLSPEQGVPFHYKRININEQKRASNLITELMCKLEKCVCKRGYLSHHGVLYYIKPDYEKFTISHNTL